jgi:hypothetical protein
MFSIKDFVNRHLTGDTITDWLFTHLGEPKETPSWSQDVSESNELYSMYRSYEVMVKAKFLYTKKRFAETIAYLDLDENKNGLGGFLLGMLEMNCLKAAAMYHTGEEKAAVALLEECYAAAIPNSIIIPFIELGNDMRILANAAIEQGSSIPHHWLEDVRSRASAY